MIMNDKQETSNLKTAKNDILLRGSINDKANNKWAWNLFL